MRTPLVYIDANAFIAGFELPADQAEPGQDLLRALRERSISAVTSELTLAEVLAPTTREAALPLESRRSLYINLLVWSQLVDLAPVTREVPLETVDLRQEAPHRLPDAIHVVTATRTGCNFFLSGDKRIRPSQNMILVQPDRSGVNLVLSAASSKA